MLNSVKNGLCRCFWTENVENVQNVPNGFKVLICIARMHNAISNSEFENSFFSYVYWYFMWFWGTLEPQKAIFRYSRIMKEPIQYKPYWRLLQNFRNSWKGGKCGLYGTRNRLEKYRIYILCNNHGFIISLASEFLHFLFMLLTLHRIEDGKLSFHKEDKYLPLDGVIVISVVSLFGTILKLYSAFNIHSILRSANLKTKPTVGRVWKTEAQIVNIRALVILETDIFSHAPMHVTSARNT